ncbi:major facilitator superfamily MFS_1 [Kribbella flavida DSM 17836]|uniref:Major facilitator superfamily MFS_1 n=1 Tax=Kribbella flavida (strain DSM 17836 / JCM 10339 / NBRC 14399) TaxID=479435 RepID=D2PMV1_KRIFD|nr:MFS transporter [Kribbella flavida]ADB32653.1 major facilitator superfamily MFS_1 [Kribbella flavida DSM 17836]
MGFLSAPAAVDKREYWGFSLYDWANSGYVTTTGTVLFAPYLTSVAETAACGRVGTTDDPCRTNLEILGLGIAPGSLAFYVVTVATLVSALFLPVVGAIADRSPRKKVLMCGFAWTGALAASCMVFVTDGRWALGALLLFIGNLCLGSSMVVYDSILVDIAPPDDRDDVSSRAWAFGYLGGFILLAINLAVVTAHDALGLSQGDAVRLSLLSAGLWWGFFTFVPFVKLRNRPPAGVVPVGGGSMVRQSFGQLGATLRHLRSYPMTLLFLVAYLFFNDGIQTVISVSSTYGEKQLGFETQVLIATILLVQFVAFFGAIGFGRFARRYGSHRTIMGGLVVWMAIVVAGFGLPERQIVPFLAMGVAIGIVLGGTQALSRSAYSQLIPKGREAEYFSLYQAGERGTSWLGTLVFGLVHQLTGSYRPAIVALGLFFVVGLVLLSRVDMRRGIAEAGNTQPTIV